MKFSVRFALNFKFRIEAIKDFLLTGCTFELGISTKLFLPDLHKALC